MRALPALLLALILIPATAGAAWIPNGNPVCTAVNTQNQVSLSPDGNGGFYVAWTDARDSGTDVYLSRVLGDGTIAPGWPVNGLRISFSSAGTDPAVVPDGAGGALVLWQKSGRLRFQRIDGGGHAFFPEDGNLLFAPLSFMQSPFAVAPDGAGGAYVAWIPISEGTSDTLRVTRVNSAGSFVPPFTVTGVPFHTISSASVLQVYQSLQLSRDTSGGVGVAASWVYDGPFAHYYSVVGHVSANASVTFQQSPYGGDTSSIGIVSDGRGGVLSWWYPYERFGTTFPRLQSYGSQGQKQWPDSTQYAGEPATLLGDGGTGAYVIETPTAQRIQARRLLADGSLAPGWPANGILIAQNQNAAEPVPLVPTSNGFLAVWADKNPDLNLHAAAWMSNGALAPGWPIGGATVSAATGDQKNAVVLPSSTNGAFVVWEDSRGGNVDLYANRVEAAPPVAVPVPGASTLAFRAIAPNPARDFVRVDLALDAGQRATLELIDVRGRVRARVTGTSSSTVPLGGLAPGLYWLRAIRDGSTATARLAIVR